MDSYTHTDGRILMLGKKPARFDERTPQFHKYLDEAATPAPAQMDWYKGTTEWEMMGNDTLGDCTIASKGHDIQVCSLNTYGMATLTTEQAIEYYSKFDGYVPGDPNTDQGGDILTVLQDWKAQEIAGHKLLAYTSISPTNFQHLMKAVELFGTVDIGIQLPITAQAQVGGVWDVVGDPSTDPNSQPGSWGGHDVNFGKYQVVTTPEGIIFYPITWGQVQAMTSRFVAAYCDEAYGLLLGTWLDHAVWPGGSPSGFDMKQLLADTPLITN